VKSSSPRSRSSNRAQSSSSTANPTSPTASRQYRVSRQPNCPLMATERVIPPSLAGVT
jgi:hypothetical protein